MVMFISIGPCPYIRILTAKSSIGTTLQCRYLVSTTVILIVHSAGDHFSQLFGPYASWAHSVSKELIVLHCIIIVQF